MFDVLDNVLVVLNELWVLALQRVLMSGCKRVLFNQFFDVGVCQSWYMVTRWAWTCPLNFGLDILKPLLVLF